MGKKPSRIDLLGAVTSLQGFIGKAMGANNDRNPNRQAELADYLERAHDLCIEARSADPSDDGYKGRFANRDIISKAI